MTSENVTSDTYMEDQWVILVIAKCGLLYLSDFNWYSHIMGYSEQYTHINSECAYRGKQQKIKS